MSFNILETAKSYLTPDLILKASTFLGENESAVSKALSGILPALFSGMISKTSSGNIGAAETLRITKDAYNTGMLDNLGHIFRDGGNTLEKGIGIARSILGDKLGSIVSAIASYSGIKNSSASSLFSLAAPIAAGTLGKYAVRNNLDTDGFASLINSQKSSILNMLPDKLKNIAGNLGIGSMLNVVNDIAVDGYNAAEKGVKKAGGTMKWAGPVVLTISLIALAWWFLLGGNSGCTAQKDNQKETNNTSVNTPVADDHSGDSPATEHESLKVMLPDGTELDAWKGGIEDKLVHFLNTDWKKLGEDSLKNTWFDFDNLNFKTGKAVITSESEAQINNIIRILKAFPTAKLKIGGYTDKTGDEATNKRISEERARAVWNAIDNAGKGMQIISAEGYGSDFAKYPATAPESDRAKDRRVSVSVRER